MKLRVVIVLDKFQDNCFLSMTDANLLRQSVLSVDK
jgi:hypothetical protein